MGKEIERKFLLKSDSWRHLAKGVLYRQGYLSRIKERTVRVRITDRKGYITVKGIAKGFTRSEYEYEIPFDDAEAMLSQLCEKPLIEKIRYTISYGGLLWEVDEFLGENQGLILAEVELAAEDQRFDMPEWVGKEVTGMHKYANSNLVANPFLKWN